MSYSPQVIVDSDLEKAMRLLRKKLQSAGTFREMRFRRWYEKPSDKKKRKLRESKNRERRKLVKTKTKGRFRGWGK